MVELIECAEVLHDAPACLAFLEAWQRWRGHDLVTAPDQVRPEELGRALVGLSILGVHSRNRVTFRLQGAAMTAAIRRDFTGEEISSIAPKETLRRARERCWNIVAIPCGALADLTYVRASGVSFPTRRLMLPVLSKSSDEPKRIYVAMETYGEQANPYEPPPSPAAILEEFTYVDIGAGVPT